jgi:hypothetical protein
VRLVVDAVRGERGDAVGVVQHGDRVLAEADLAAEAIEVALARLAQVEPCTDLVRVTDVLHAGLVRGLDHLGRAHLLGEPVEREVVRLHGRGLQRAAALVALEVVAVGVVDRVAADPLEGRVPRRLEAVPGAETGQQRVDLE